MLFFGVCFFLYFIKLSAGKGFQLPDGYTMLESLTNSIIVVQLHFCAVNQNIIKMAPYSKNMMYNAYHIF